MENIAPEFSRLVDIRDADGKARQFTASAQECPALAERFGLAGLDSLVADVTLSGENAAIVMRGTLTAEIRQICSITAEEFSTVLAEDIEIRFEPELEGAEEIVPDEEIELTEQDFDVEYYTGDKIDIGEAIAQSLAIALDPYPRGPDADEAEARANISTPEDNSPFAALKDLGKKDS